jgi:hypothetical protein
VESLKVHKACPGQAQENAETSFRQLALQTQRRWKCNASVKLYESGWHAGKSMSISGIGQDLGTFGSAILKKMQDVATRYPNLPVGG